MSFLRRLSRLNTRSSLYALIAAMEMRKLLKLTRLQRSQIIRSGFLCGFPYFDACRLKYLGGILPAAHRDQSVDAAV